MERSFINAQSVSRRRDGGQFSQSVRSRVCIDVNRLPSNSECEDDSPKEAPAPPFIFGLSHSTQASENGQSCASGNQKSGSMHPKPMKKSHFQHGRTVDWIVQHAGESGGRTQIAKRKHWIPKDKLVVLEERFKERSNLDAKRKTALAMQLNLRPRQVEVWFQNRRARNKLKRIEVDNKTLKKHCEALSEENRQLQKEIVGLRILTMGGQYFIPRGFNMHFPVSTLTLDSFGKFLTPPSVAVTLAASTTTSISSLNQSSNIPSTLSSPCQPSPACS